MKRCKEIFVITMLISIHCVVFADRRLNTAEVLELFEALTSQQRTAWLAAGVLKADHEEFKSSIGKSIISKVECKYDGQRYRTRIDIVSAVRTGRANNPAAPMLDIKGNKTRVFVWDGEKYTIYSRSGRNAIVMEDAGIFSNGVGGIFEAGIVPWGYGAYMMNYFTDAELSGIEKEIDGQTELHLAVNKTDRPDMEFVLAPDKGYAVKSHRIHLDDTKTIAKAYSNYRKYGETWIPLDIYCQTYENIDEVKKQISSDMWRITEVDTTIPTADVFDPNYVSGDFVEYFESGKPESIKYYRNDFVDTDLLLLQKIAMRISGQTNRQNCATATLKIGMYLAGGDITDEQLSGLVDEQSGSTSLYEMANFVRNANMYCQAVKTDIGFLQELNDCQAILYLPSKKHFVLLGGFDGEKVWLMDLSANKICYPMRLREFQSLWREGISLLISDGRIELGEGIAVLNDQDQQRCIGSGGFTCTNKINNFDVQLCTYVTEVTCGGIYRMYYDRYGCEPSGTESSCSGEKMVKSIYAHCVNDPFDPAMCTTVAECYFDYVRACN